MDKILLARDYLHDLPPLVALTTEPGACPSQWEGQFADGRPLYVRYRYGRLTAHEGVHAPAWFVQQDGDVWAGSMTTEEMLRRVGLRRAPAGEVPHA